MKKLLLLGDSTCSDKKDETRRPEMGWGETIGQYLADGWIVDNRALNGRSTKSFIDEGLFESALEAANNGDAAIIQFGHNDNKPDPLRGTEPFGSYADNLAYMAGKLMEKGVSVYFITSISRRHFTEDGTLIYTHGDYPAAMKYAGWKLGIPVIDLSTITMIELQKMGELESRKLYMYFEKGELDKFPEGKIDNTHLKKAGAEWISRLICEELLKLCVKPNFLK